MCNLQPRRLNGDTGSFLQPLKGFHMEDDTVLFNTDPEITVTIT